MLDIKDLQIIELQVFHFYDILILLIFLIIKSLKSRKNTWILHLLSLLSLLSRQNSIRIYLNINITVAHCALTTPFQHDLKFCNPTLSYIKKRISIWTNYRRSFAIQPYHHIKAKTFPAMQVKLLWYKIWVNFFVHF